MTIKRRLDKSRSAGTIFPPMPHADDPTAVAHYEQDGFYFDHEGRVLEAFLTPEQRKQFEPVAPKPPKPAASGQPEEDGEDDTPPQPAPAPKKPKTRQEKLAEKNPKKPASGDDLNLEMWLRGEAKYQEFRVKKVVRDRYNRVCSGTQELVRFLVEEVNLVPKEALKPEFAAFYEEAETGE